MHQIMLGYAICTSYVHALKTVRKLVCTCHFEGDQGSKQMGTWGYD